MLEFQVWSRPPGKDALRFVAAFDVDRWQWAEKLGQMLRDRGHTSVYVVSCEEGQEPDFEDD